VAVVSDFLWTVGLVNKKVIEILGDTLSKKRNYQIVKRGRFSTLMLTKRYKVWAKSAALQLSVHRPIEAVWPIHMHFYFYRKTLRHFDFVNLAQGPQDALQDAGIIPEDDMAHVIPVFHGEYAGWEKDKENPRVVITIIGDF